MAIFVGVDGGGTNTRIIISDENEKILHNVVIEKSINYNVYGELECANNLIFALVESGINLRESICALAIGDPSVDDITVNTKTQNFISILRTSHLLKNAKIIIQSDVYMALLGLETSSITKEKALVVSGTGSMGIATNADGVIYVSGGYGRTLCDPGSAYYIGLCGLLCAFKSYDKINEYTLLEDYAKSFLGTSNLRTSYEKLESNKDLIARFALQVDKAAQNNDTQAQDILEKAAYHLSEIAISLFNKAGIWNAPLGIYGSVLLNNKTVRSSFSNIISKKLPHAIICTPKTQPELCALRLAIEKGKKEIDI